MGAVCWKNSPGAFLYLARRLEGPAETGKGFSPNLMLAPPYGYNDISV